MAAPVAVRAFEVHTLGAYLASTTVTIPSSMTSAPRSVSSQNIAAIGPGSARPVVSSKM
jgi:hypothetical protein